jgi:hypothetical protein
MGLRIQRAGSLRNGVGTLIRPAIRLIPEESRIDYDDVRAKISSG